MTNVFTCLMKNRARMGASQSSDVSIDRRLTVVRPSFDRRSALVKLCAVLVLVLMVGVGQMWGATTTTYTFSSAKWAASPSNWTSVTDGSGIENTGSARGVANNGVNGAATSPSSFSGVTSISVVASANKGDGSIKISIGSTEIATKTVANSNNATYTFNSSDYATIASLSGNVKIEVTAPSSSKTLWVKSVAITYVTEKFTVTYDAGSGSCDTDDDTQGSIGAALTLPSASPNDDCADKGWVFAGWAASSCTETSIKPTLYAASSSYIPLSSHTLYAVYRLGDVYSIDFESAESSYTSWTFTNITSGQTNANVVPHEGSKIGLTSNTTSAQTIETKSAIALPKCITFFVSKTSGNTTASSWSIYASESNSSWGDAIKTQDATSMGQGEWVKVSQDLSSYSNVYIKVEYGTSGAIRAIDDLELSCAIYNSNPDCVYDYFIDIMHDNETIEKQGTYSMPSALSDATPGATYCDEKHYHFLGWVEETYIKDDGTLDTEAVGFEIIPAGDSGHTANNKTYYAIWAAEE